MRLLFVTPRVPYPLNRGDRSRSYHLVAELARRFEVDVVALEGDPAAATAFGRRVEGLRRVACGRRSRAPRWLRAAVHVISGRSATFGYFSPGESSFRAMCHGPYDLVVGFSAASIPHVLSVSARARVADLVDADSAKWDAFAERDRGLRRWIERREARAVRRLERRAAEELDRVWFSSRQEVELASLPAEKAAVAPSGVDAEYFRPVASHLGSERPEIVFTGGLDYRPNVEGVDWFARRVLPRVRELLPEVRFTIVGRDPVRAVRRLARQPGVELAASVPDVRPYLERASVAVAPLRLAPGVATKVLEALAMERPVVASEAALRGWELDAGCGVLLARGADEWTATLADLLRDVERRRALGRRGRDGVLRTFGWSRTLQPLVDDCVRRASDRRP